MLYEIALISSMFAMGGYGIYGEGFVNENLWTYTYYNEFDGLGTPYEQTIRIEYILLTGGELYNSAPLYIALNEEPQPTIFYLEDMYDINNDSIPNVVYLDVYDTWNQNLKNGDTLTFTMGDFGDDPNALVFFHFEFINSYYLDIDNEEIDIEEIYNNGYAIGLNEGYSTGYQAGYNIGSSETVSFDWLKESLKCVREITELEIFPGIKLSYILGIFLIIPLVSWLVGWFK